MSGIGAKALSKVRDMEVKAKNEIRNSDFSNGFSGWHETGNIVDNGDSLKVNNHRIYHNSLNKIPNEHVVYLSAEVKLDEDGTASIFFTRPSFKTNNLGANEWTVISDVIDGVNYNKGTLQIRTDLDNFSLRKRVNAIDLTKSFGKGNEPTTEQMDIILSQFPNSWFDGTQTITKEFMFMLLNEINNTKKAVTTLGGNS